MESLCTTSVPHKNGSHFLTGAIRSNVNFNGFYQYQDTTPIVFWKGLVSGI